MKDTHVNQIPEITNDATSVDATNIANWVSRHKLSEPSQCDSGSKSKDTRETGVCGASEVAVVSKQTYAEQVLTADELLLYQSYKRKRYTKQHELITEIERAAKLKYENARRDRSPEHTLASMYTSAKGRAKRRGIQWELTFAEFVELAKATTHCPVFGCELVYQFYTGKGYGHKDECRASLDRKNSSKGYTIDNVWIISWKANVMKMQHTTAELEQLVQALKANNIQ